MVETRGRRDGAERLRGLQGRIKPVLVLPGYWGAEDGLPTDGVGQDGRGGGVAWRGHNLLESLAGTVLVSHEVWTETCNKHYY